MRNIITILDLLAHRYLFFIVDPVELSIYMWQVASIQQLRIVEFLYYLGTLMGIAYSTNY